MVFQKLSWTTIIDIYMITIKILKSQLLQRHCNFQGWECSIISHILLNKFKDQNKKNNS